MEPRAFNLLTLNTGSSSLKGAVYLGGSQPERVLSADAIGIGQGAGRIRVVDVRGNVLLERNDPLPDHPAALELLVAWLRENGRLDAIAGVGHRVVHGGLKYQQPVRIDAAVLANLKALVPLAPDHLPQSIAAIETLAKSLPKTPQVACFDTAFHRTLPPRARTLPLSRSLDEQGVVRFGFHGLSYEYLVEQLQSLDPVHCGGRAILAHLGNGASMAAVRRGQSVDTSMGFTPAGGLVMSARTGDLDPGVLVYLLKTKSYTDEQLNALVNRDSGLMGISGLSSSMQELLAARETHERAALAVDIFCYQAQKFLGAYAAALGGLDTVVFAGGIGENSATIRQQICTELEFLGIRLDSSRNQAHAEVISAADSGVTVRVIKTDEDLMIARHTNRLLAQQEE